MGFGYKNNAHLSRIIKELQVWKYGGEYVSEAVQIALIFCTTIVAIVGIVAMVIYNRDNMAMKVQTKANIIDKAKTDFLVEIRDKKN